MPKKILIVDDNEFMVEVMTYILNNEGYEVIPLHNGDNVIAHIKNDHPDLILLDIVLPGINGQDICRSIKMNKDTRDLPVIMCSGDDAIDESLNQQGAPNAILRKPFDLQSLVQNIELQLAA
jgi:DNA-binding response OmpR family regulator